MKNHFRWWNVFGLAAVLIINVLAERLPINGKTTGQISAQYPVLITPAPYAFSIWIVIYILLMGFVIYQFLPRANSDAIIQNIGPWFFISCVLNCTWIIVWHFDKVNSSVFVMLALLLSLIAIYSKVQKSKPTQHAKAHKWLVQLPFSIYLGWISTAAIVNISVALYATKWSGFGISDVTWTVIMLIIACLLSLVVGFKYLDPVFVLVFIWSFVAISVKKGQVPAVMLTAWLAAAIMTVVVVLILIKSNKEHKQSIDK